MTPEKSDGTTGQLKNDQFLMVMKVLTVLVLACLVVSVCFNVYLVYENSVIKTDLANYAKLRQEIVMYMQMKQMTQRLVADMLYLAKDDPKTRGLLQKYWRPITRYNLDAATGSSPAPSAPPGPAQRKPPASRRPATGAPKAPAPAIGQ